MLGRLTGALAIGLGGAMLALGTGHDTGPEITYAEAPVVGETPASLAGPDVQASAGSIRSLAAVTRPPAPSSLATPPARARDPASDLAIAALPAAAGPAGFDIDDVIPTSVPLVTLSATPTVRLDTTGAPGGSGDRLAPATILKVIRHGTVLRDGPSDHEMAVIRLSPGDTAKLIGDLGNGWLLVKTMGTGRQGFIAAADLVLLAD